MEQVAMPWYKSKIIVGAIVSAVTKLLVLTGLLHGIDSGVTDRVVDMIVLASGLIADVWIGHERATQKTAPIITANKGGAEVVKQATAIVQQAAVVPAVVDEAADVLQTATGLEVPSWMQR